MPTRGMSLVFEITTLPEPRWFMPVLKRAGEILNLPDGWDSYKAKEIDPSKVANGIKLLSTILKSDSPSPSVVPISDGGIQFEWHTGEIDFEIQMLTAGVFAFSFEGCDEEVCVEATSNVEQVKAYAVRLPNNS